MAIQGQTAHLTGVSANCRALAGAGAYFGELSLLYDAPRQATVISVARRPSPYTPLTPGLPL